MKTTLLFLSLFFAMYTIAQNGGQTNESGSLKIEQFGYMSGEAWISITNKQPCAVNVEVKYGAATLVTSVAGNSKDTLLIAVLVGAKVKAKPLTGCSVSFDNGNIELTIAGQILPVKFLSFSATANGSSVILQWITEEDQVNYYTIEESNDGADWSTTAIHFAGYTTYSYTDKTGSVYYRIASVDQDGSVHYSRIVKVTVESNKEQLAVFPNPVISTASVSIKESTASKISLYSLTGVLVKQLDTKGQKVLQLDLTGLPSGIYYVTDGVNSVKLNKQ